MMIIGNNIMNSTLSIVFQPAQSDYAKLFFVTSVCGKQRKHRRAYYKRGLSGGLKMNGATIFPILYKRKLSALCRFEHVI